MMLRSRAEIGNTPEGERRKCTTCADAGRVLTASCCECGSTEFETWPYDYGVDRETGYRDSGTRAKCHNCGFEGDLQGDFERYAECEDCKPLQPWQRDYDPLGDN